MPLPSEVPCGEGTPEWTVAIRFQSGWCTPEALWLLEAPWDGGLVLSVRRAVGSCIEEQIRALRPPQIAQAPELVAKLELAFATFNSTECPEIATLRDEAEVLTIPLIPQNFIPLHDDTFEVFSDTCHREPVRFRIAKAAGSYWGRLDATPHPVLAFVERIKQVTEQCSARRRP